MQQILRGAAIAAPHGALLVGAWFLSRHALPPSLAGLWTLGPWVALALAAFVAAAFGRGRVVFAAIALAVAYACYRFVIEANDDVFVRRTAFVALTVFTPAYLAMLATLPERGVFNGHGALRLAPIALAAAFTAWIIHARRTETTDWAYAPAFDFTLNSAIPQQGIAATLIAFAVAVACAALRGMAVEVGLAATIVAIALAADGVRDPAAFPAFTLGGCAVLLVAVLQDSYRMAFRDELTGLAGRRALNDRLAALGRRYTIAMVDVDHFKGCNDTYGHDVGDQVLRMVAARMTRVGGGGKPFRYGGEEFTVLFPGTDADKALPHLEALRADIEGYRMSLRSGDRPAERKRGKTKRGATSAAGTVSVTVSIGVAARSDQHPTPDAVLKAADKALYRAKNKGRNRISK